MGRRMRLARVCQLMTVNSTRVRLTPEILEWDRYSLHILVKIIRLLTIFEIELEFMGITCIGGLLNTNKKVLSHGQ